MHKLPRVLTERILQKYLQSFKIANLLTKNRVGREFEIRPNEIGVALPWLRSRCWDWQHDQEEHSDSFSQRFMNFRENLAWAAL